MMAEQRRTARSNGKTDPIDALAVAREVGAMTRPAEHLADCWLACVMDERAAPVSNPVHSSR